MKKTITKLLSILLYILLLFWLVDFSVVTIIDTKTLLVLILGTIILTVADRLSEHHNEKTEQKPGKSLMSAIRQSLMITGYAATLLLLLFGLKTNNTDSISSLVEAGRPLMYAFILAQVMDVLSMPSQQNNINNTADSFVSHDQDTQNTQNLPAAIVQNVDEIFRVHLLSCGLSAREIEIAEYVSQGRTNAEIALMLFISAATVKKHVQRIFEKTGVEKREKLMMIRLSGSDTPIVRQIYAQKPTGDVSKNE